MADQIRALYFQAAVILIMLLLVTTVIGTVLENTRINNVKSAISKIRTVPDELSLESCGNSSGQLTHYRSGFSKLANKVNRQTLNLLQKKADNESEEYAALQAQFWLNSISLKDRCGFNSSVILYLFRNRNSTISESLKNSVQSSILSNLDKECKGKIMVLSMRADRNADIVGNILERFNISSYPATIINDDYVFQGSVKMEKLREILDC